MSYIQREARYYMQVVNRLPLQIASGKGSFVYDTDGKEYLDFTAGWSCLNLGHSHPEVTEAIRRQAGLVMQVTNLYYTGPQLELAEMLVENSCLDRVFFTNSGAEANEGACKLARKWGRLRLGGAHEIITATDSFHGRTLAMMAATGQPKYHEEWKPLMPGFVNVPYNDLEAVKRATSDKTCAVLMEPVQGEGGVNVPDAGYLINLQKWCRQNGILLMLDEVQTGMGRLGTLFGYQRFAGVEPDVVTLAKALGGGTPLGAFACRQDCAVLEPGEHGTTFGGNALTTAAGAATVRHMLEHDIPRQALRAGEELAGKLEALREQSPLVTRVKGMGLLIGVELSREIAPDIVRAAMGRGLLVNAVRPGVIRLLPPLNITKQEMERAVAVMAEALRELEEQQ